MAISKLNITDYPNMDRADINSFPNIPYGTIEEVYCHCIVGGATAYSTADITAAATSITVDDATAFPTAPFTIQIEDERLRVTAVATDTLTVTRAYDNTLAAAHTKDNTVFEVKTEYVYLVSDSPVKAINAVYVDGNKQLASDSRVQAYTGVSGDEHADWAGKAVIAFTSDAYVDPQFNIENPNQKQSGVAVAGTVNAAIDFKLHDSQSSYMTIGELAPTTAWVEFAVDGGTITRQEYAISVTSGGSEVKCIASVTKAGTAAVIRQYTIPASTSMALTMSQEGGSWDDVLSVACGVGNLNVTSMTKTVTKRREKYTVDTNYASQDPTRVIEYIEDNAHIKFATYPTTALGTAVVKEVHSADITLTATTTIIISGNNASTNNSYGFTEYELGSGSYTITNEYTGGDWDSVTKIVASRGGSFTCSAINKTIYYESEETASTQAANTATSSARIVIGDEITVDVDGIVDTSGDYGGATTLIERPDWVIKHFIVNYLGFVLADIDATTFAAAGTSFGTAISGGYKFAFVWSGEDVKRMAFESRSILKFINGKWYLDYLPDTAPAATKTIAYTELAGKNAMFTFDKMDLVDIGNDLTAKFKRSSKSGSEYIGTATATDSASVTKYGTYPYEYTFRFIRLKAVADDVLAHILLEKKVPLMTVAFHLFFEHFDLGVGDTIDITNPIFTGTKFFIEEIKRDKAKMSIRGKQWY